MKSFETERTRAKHRTNLDIKNDAVMYSICGGTQSKRVTDGLYPIVAAMVGKNAKKDCDMFTNTSGTANHHTVRSVRASTREHDEFVLSESSMIPRRPCNILSCAKNCSSAVSHDARLVGKSGTKQKASRATTHVKPPSVKNSHL